MIWRGHEPSIESACWQLRVGKVANYLLREEFINFPVTRYRLGHARFWIVVYVMFGTVAYLNTS